VSDPSRDDVRAAWVRLSQRYAWRLARDEEALLDQALEQCRALGPSGPPGTRAQIGVWCAYSVLLYRGLVARDERAAQELWLACMRMALRAGWAPAEAEDLAQESVARVLAKLPTLQSPAALLTWALRLFRSVMRESSRAANTNTSIDHSSGLELAEPTDPMFAVEQRMIEQQLAERLAGLLPNQLEQETLMRIVLLGEKPREIARDLQLPLYRTRVAKWRALERLRQDPALLAFLSDLTGYADPPPDNPGAEPYEP
jgi:RNA polymerase sigma factor (sigma-70 family)